ncbi:E3 ubiquitin-protein ligase TRIM17-like isoform X2 [Ctenopharyngodon idella]|uniref:E3 ubiquitin-protein ligase TRIM17-like isoform X2 n=1 Tax=Ctenopharyngodon idella TaxID=7959 RepID=UPI00222F5876|nr:E3 ubiquitin-protein ligase TRIM17-like isoform X2 [Ctenopharyngodon idella]
MASEGFSEEDFTCPVCLDFFVNPVVLPCSHSICSECIQKFWESKGSNECPICREISMTHDPPVNLALRNLCETFQQERSQRSSSEGETVCSVHKEKLKLFCLDDQQFVCLVCRDSKIHTDHKFCPIEEAVNYNKNETQDTEEKINKQFEELYEILLIEKEARITALREEEKQKSQKIMEKTEKTTKQIVSLTWTIRDIEEQMKAEDDTFLKNFKNTLKRAKRSPPDPGNVSELLIDGPKYLSDMKRTVLQKIEGSSGDHSVRGGPGFRGNKSSRRGQNFRGSTNHRGGQNPRGGPQLQGAPEFQGDNHCSGGSYRSRGGYNHRGGQSSRGGQQFQGGPEFQGCPDFQGGAEFQENSHNFGGSYRTRGGHNHRGTQSSRGGPQFQGGPEFQGGAEFQGDGQNFGGSYRTRGGHNYRGAQSSRGGPQFQGRPEFQKEF